jgi:hypothetical protein
MNTKRNWRENYVELAFEGGQIEFFDRFFSADKVSKLVIVSPWITKQEEQRISLNDIIEYINRYKIDTTIVTRSPEKEPINMNAIEFLKSNIPQYLTLYYNNSIHAKIYVCRCSPFGYALLSSTNFTSPKSNLDEVGLFVNGFGAGERIIRELELVGTDYIPGRDTTSLVWAPWYSFKKRR